MYKSSYSLLKLGMTANIKYKLFQRHIDNYILTKLNQF